jgi:hypothetical protein
MQKGYHSVDGWLGFIIGDKIFVDFTKYTLDDSLNKLKSQIKLNANKKELTNQQAPVSNMEKPLSKSSEVVDWTNEQVEKWFIERNFIDVFNELKPINAKVLNQLNQLQKFTPEFFYKSITKNHELNLLLVASFASSLQELFDN